MPLEKKIASVPVYYRVKDLIVSLLGGSLMGLAYFFFITQSFQRTDWHSLFLSTFTGAAIGISIFCAERFYRSTYSSSLSFLSSLLLFLTVYCIIALFWLTVFHSGPYLAKSGRFYFSSFRETFWIDFIFAILSSVAFTLFIEVKSLLDRGFFINYLSGKYHVQIEEERIFMFIDLDSSTAIAERLGNISYSLMLKEIFDGLTIPILATRAEVYQYVGDEVILTWRTRTGARDNRCLYCFRYIEESIAKKSEHYREHFGLVPQFKAAIHVGMAVSTIVGRIKKEIVYHGDVLNATARMQALCHQYGQKLIVSGALAGHLNTAGLKLDVLGEIKLRGRSEPIELIGLCLD